MWRILKTEFSYNRLFLFGMIGLILPLSVSEIIYSDTYGFMLLLFMFVFIQGWYVNRNRDKRELLLLQLPLPVRHVAAVRIGMISLLGLSMVVVYKIIFIIVPPAPAPYHANPATYLGLIILGFSILFVLQDLLRDFARKIGITREKVIIGSMFLLVGLSALGVVAMQMVEAGSPLPISPKPLADFLVGRSASHSGFGLVRFLAVSGFFVLASVFTFERRKSFLE